MRRGLQYLMPLMLSGLGFVLFTARAADAQVPSDSTLPGANVEVILAIDSSASMRPAIDAAKAAANEFVASMPAGVRIGVETFADDVTVLTPPTTDRGLLSELIDGIEAGGGNSLFHVAVIATHPLTPPLGKKGLVLL